MDHALGRQLGQAIAKIVREGLDAAGHGAIKFDPLWIWFRTDPDGTVIPCARIPMSRKFSVQVEQAATGPIGISDAACHAFANDLIGALPNLTLVARRLARRANIIVEAMWEQIASRRDHAMRVSDKVIGPFRADLLSGMPWQAIADEARVQIHLRILDESLSAVTQLISLSAPCEAATVFGPMLKPQAQRLHRFKLKHSPGPRLLVDGVTIGLLTSAGADPIEVLRRFATCWHASVDAMWGGERQTIYLNSKAKRVYSSMQLDKYIAWHDGALCFDKSRRYRVEPVPGQPANTLTDHPALADRTIVEVTRYDRLVTSFHARVDAPILRFDGRSGTLTPARRLRRS